MTTNPPMALCSLTLLLVPIPLFDHCECCCCYCHDVGGIRSYGLLMNTVVQTPESKFWPSCPLPNTTAEAYGFGWFDVCKCQQCRLIHGVSSPREAAISKKQEVVE